MRVFRVVAAVCFWVPAVAACTSNDGSNVMNVDENLTTTDLNDSDNTAQAPTPEPQPTPLFNFKDGDKYGYVAAVSEVDQKKGKAAGDVVLFVYRGIEAGKYKIDQVSASGTVLENDECAHPCAA